MDRYSHVEHFNSERVWFEIGKSSTGQWVKHSDVESLQEDNKRLRDGLKKCEEWDWVYSDTESEDFKEHIEYIGNLLKGGE